VRTYLYKLTSDRGGAPCALEPTADEEPLLTLAICKPAIRRTAQPGDRILGITSHALAKRDGYPLGSVIYAAVVREGLEAPDYFACSGPFLHRPDCIYEFHQLNGTAVHRGQSNLHSSEFRYFGRQAVRIPPRLHLLAQAAESLGQGHRVYEGKSPESREADTLFRLLWRRKTLYTPVVVDADAYEHH
jgi:hypothetical protein